MVDFIVKDLDEVVFILFLNGDKVCVIKGVVMVLKVCVLFYVVSDLFVF